MQRASIEEALKKEELGQDCQGASAGCEIKLSVVSEESLDTG